MIQSDDQGYLVRTQTNPVLTYQVSTRTSKPSSDSIFYYIGPKAVNSVRVQTWNYNIAKSLPDPQISALTTPGSLTYWHSKLGHASQERIREFLRLNGIPSKGSFTIHDCVSCAPHRIVAKRKLPRQTPLASRPLQVLHADLSGKTQDDDSLTPSMAGYQHFLLIKDDYTKYLWFFPLLYKSEAVKKIIELLRFLDSMFPNHRVERFFSDQGSEFNKMDLRIYLQEHVIAFDLTPTATPELNGRIEREMRTVKESGRALLEESQLPQSMWRHAFQHAVFTQNLLPRKHEDKRESVSPYYDLFILRDTDALLRRRIQTLSKQLRFFGSNGYLVNRRGTTFPKNTRPKRGIEVIWCGVVSIGSTFACYIPSTGNFSDEAEQHFQPFQRDMYCLNRLLSMLVTHFDPMKDKTQLDFVKRTWRYAFRQLQSRLAEQATQSLTPDRLLPDAEDERISAAVADADTAADGMATTVSAITDVMPALSHPSIEFNGSLSSTVVGVTGRSREEEDDRNVILCGTHEELLDQETLAAIAMMDLQTPVGRDPNSYREAMHLSDAVLWKQACDVEMEIIKRREVLELVDRPKGVRIHGCRWVLKRKLSDTGTPLKYKARLVVQGFTQLFGLEYDETYADVVSTDILFLMLKLAAQNAWHVEQLDVKSAFLYGDLEHDIYMRQPEGYQDGTNRVYHLKKSLYGLKQAPRQWSSKLSKILEPLKFTKVSDFQGLFICRETKTYIVVYVDDILIVSQTKRETIRVRTEIEKALEITSSGFPESYLSLHIERTAAGLTLDARKNVVKLLEDYRELFSKHDFKKIPPILPSEAQKAVQISKIEDGLLPKDEDLEKESRPLSDWETVRFRSAVGSLNYLVSKCRPDIAFAASQLSTYLKKPNKLHWRMLMRLLAYLDSSKEAQITFTKQKNPKLIGYSDATFSGEHVRHPHGGYLWYYGNSLLYWSSRRERRACVSIHEAELRCLINALEYGEGIRKLLILVGEVSEDDECVLYTDSQSSYNVMNSEKINRTSRRMGVHLDKIHDLMSFANIRVMHCEGKRNPADVLTKPLSEPAFKAAVRELVQLPNFDTQQGSVGTNVPT